MAVEQGTRGATPGPSEGALDGGGQQPAWAPVIDLLRAGRTVAEVATALGISQGAVVRQMWAAVDFLLDLASFLGRRDPS